VGFMREKDRLQGAASGVYSQSRPDSIVGSEYETTDGFERTRKHYAKLANRRSVFIELRTSLRCEKKRNRVIQTAVPYAEPATLDDSFESDDKAL
jgi:hypothetical protein